MLELITGSMFAGKTTRFIARVENLRQEGKNVVVLKPIQDFRYSKNDVVSHDGLRVKGLAVDEVFEIREIVEEEGCDVIAMDEIQFFGWDFVEVVNELADRGVHVLLAGLDMDFTGRPFGIMPELLAYADVLTKLHAKCSVCDGVASRNQRLVNGKPAKAHDPIFVSGEHIRYEPRCRIHHEVKDV